MGDSDDEYDRRRRDKFRRERSDYDRSRERDERRRDDWSDRDWERGRERRSRDYRDYDRTRRERFSPPRHELSPPQKRLRRDWDDHGTDPYHSGYELPYSGGGAGPTYGPPQTPWGPHEMQHQLLQHQLLPIQARLGTIAEVDLGMAPPVMKSFKEFLLSLDDAVDETEAVKRYNDYKLDFRRQQLQEFFLAHKDEEWFRSKYHPDEAGKRQQEAQAALRNRLGVFLYLWEHGWFDNLLLDIDRAPQIIKTLDAAVIKMEGGTEHDLRILEQEEEEERTEKAEGPKKEEPRPPEPPGKGPTERPDGDDSTKAEGAEPGAEPAAGAGPEEEEEGPDKGPKAEDGDKEGGAKGRPRQRSRDSEDGDSDSGDSEGGTRRAPGKDEEPKEDKGHAQDEAGTPPTTAAQEPKEDKGHAQDEAGTPPTTAAPSPPQKGKEGVPGGVPGGPPEPKPRPLHKTCSLFMRNIAPNIAQAEIVALCKRYPGFMRVALSEPQPERRFFRRGWVTFDRSVNIKEICWSLQNIRLRECELSPGVNRDLTRRVRNVSGLTQHRPVVRHDIKLAARLVQALDARARLWSPPGAAAAPETPGDGGDSAQNPVLRHITDYLIEEVSAEEEELLGQGQAQGQGQGQGAAPAEDAAREANPAEVTVERDEKLLKVLDRLLLYLRIVHSVDYYNTSEYPNEDEMPNRCGIIHVRGPLPPNRVSHGEVAEWQRGFEARLAPLLAGPGAVPEEEAQRLGRKDPEQELEKFVSANTQELGKDKWLCPLSGKKFKGPEFVRKHIFNKHGDKMGAVRKEVLFFNNFLMDPKRPALPEGGKGGPAAGPNAGSHPYPPGPYGGRGSYETFRGQGGAGGGYLNKPRSRMVRGDPRAIVEYRDLDAPEDVDFF
ncbi:PREDICTED: serrate RNA effector molecule homolog [Pseudopodoces humilis]|uniref:serrate RNA effector molecule homolog n=1 Tax=Pseudopodoces humilis TaxID=181119 RepID=UPI0006B70375|nr:PREDICTED: serrate RNA effector molecule homolog [Pseudopodoces humilis]